MRIEVYKRALQIMAEELIANDLRLEEMFLSGDTNAHISMPKDLDAQIALTCKDYLEQAEEELSMGFPWKP
jgi:hypothetical protein